MKNGPYILQRQIMDDRRGLWFDAERFETAERAAAALKYEQACEQLSISGAGGSGYSGRRAQTIRIVKAQ
jgi:hypothetical protein